MLRLILVAGMAVAVTLGLGQVGITSQGKRPNILESVARFLSLAQVQKELGLSAAASKAISAKMTGAIRTTMSSMQNAGPNQKPADRMKSMQEMQERLVKTQRECLAMLTASQRSRLKQIGLQQMGAMALTHPEVQKALALNSTQSKNIGKVVSDGTRKMFAGMQRPDKVPQSSEQAKKSFAEFAKRREAGQKRVLEESLRHLTAEQRSKWRSLLGKPFKLDMVRMASGK